MKSQRHTAGFTLVELMVTLTISAILIGVAIPSFRTLITNNAVENLQSRLAGAITFARSEAATRNSVVTLCSSNTGAGCVANQWTAGWIVFVDSNGNQTADPAAGAVPAEEILQRYQSNNTYPIKFQQEAVGAGAAAPLSALSFTSQGFVRGEIRAFATFCSPDNKPQYTKGLTVERSGRVMQAKEIAFDTGNGKTILNLTCP
jgi:prepilin-type N-terminal cleavage/methylation domain-containing protein